ncbi:MAG: sigma-70 family RNA polymerase sigma factor [Deltaproteobacteria bacterium]|nr:sigma-70 family RNA polymerase sigma factor [Deltaproteobacteria bacterium]
MVDVETLYRTYGPMVLRRCRRLLRDEGRALDAMQDTFVQVLRYEKSLDAEAPSSLLYRIATNVSLNKLRSERRKPTGDSATAEGESIVEKLISHTDSESAGIARMMLDKLFAKETPSTLEMAVFHLHDGMTLEEVAELTGLSVSGVRKRLRGLRERLAELEGTAVGEGAGDERH